MQPYRFSSFDKKKDLRFQVYKNILMNIQISFSQQLFSSTNQMALNYLFQRGLKKNIIEEFKLGYVPWKNDFYDELTKKYSEDEINLTGFTIKMTKLENILIDLIQE